MNGPPEAGTPSFNRMGTPWFLHSGGDRGPRGEGGAGDFARGHRGLAAEPGAQGVPRCCFLSLVSCAVPVELAECLGEGAACRPARPCGEAPERGEEPSRLPQVCNIFELSPQMSCDLADSLE